MTQQNIEGRLALIKRYEQRIQEEQDQLDYMTINSTWFRLHQTTESGGLIDVTENAKDGIRKAIEDYRRAIGHLNTWE